MNRLASRGQTGASIRNIDVEAMELLTKQVNEACQFAFNLIGEVTPFVVEQVTFFAGRVEKIITDEVVPVATRLGMREDQAARVNATFLGQLRSRKEQLLDDFVHGMQGSERLKKDPVLNVIANQTNSPGATQQIGIGDKFTQSAFTQNHTELIAVIDRALESPEFAKLNTSQKGVGQGFLSGWMGSIDPARAARYFRFAMDKGDARSTFRLADMTLQGNGVKKDEVEADRLAEKAALQGNREAQAFVGARKLMPYLAGLTDHAEDALKWLNMAADQNEPIAMRFLANFYHSLGARTGEVNLARGNELLKRCVEKTADPGCAFAYGEAINAGVAEPRDVKKAYALFMLANRDGRNRAAATKLEQIARELTKTDIVNAQMIASELSVSKE
ncbi:tetratricopeptide repeat protein [Rhodopseudomonas pseudopalustris]|nr:tetratricopeptide repeat protein [Rhodopseudomonas pseudopalustris]